MQHNLKGKINIQIPPRGTNSSQLVTQAGMQFVILNPEDLAPLFHHVETRNDNNVTFIVCITAKNSYPITSRKINL